MKNIFISSILIFSSSLSGESGVANNGLSKKIDLILGKIGRLESRVSKLETENKAVKLKIKEATRVANSNLQIPKDEEEKDSFFKKLKNQIASQEAKDSGPWANRKNWLLVKNNLTRVQVRRLLGNPHRVKLNNNPRIDQVYQYSGDLDADGTVDVGEVNFFKDRVISFTAPL
jgi:hypothetical protein